jgi:hypothetical protein
VMCSHALPAMGSTMNPRKLRLRPHWLLTCSHASNRKDAPKPISLSSHSKSCELYTGPHISCPAASMQCTYEPQPKQHLAAASLEQATQLSKISPSYPPPQCCRSGTRSAQPPAQ